MLPSYRALVAQPSWRRFFFASTASRLPITMGVFGMVLAGHRLGSFALGARLAALYTLTGAATAVWRGRRMDHGDLRKGLRRDGAVVAVVAAGMAACVQLHGPVLLAGALAVALGTAMAAIPGGYRALLSAVVPPAEVNAAYALDAVCVEACFVTGPAVAAMTAWFSGPTGIFVAMAVCAVVGSWAASRLPSVSRERPADGYAPAPYRVGPMPGILVAAVAAGTGIGMLDASFPAFAVTLGSRAAMGGVFITVMALGSGIGGLILGPRVAHGEDLARRAATLLLLFGLIVMPLAMAPSLPVAALLGLICGAPFALMITSASVLIQRSVHASRTAEAFSLVNAGLLGGGAIGSALASTLLGSAGARVTVLLAGVGPAVGAVVLLFVVAGVDRRSRPMEMACRATN